MATQYTLNFSDPSKTENITITGPIRNNYSTSLDLVGPGYVAYGETIAQDFLKLLENFASPNPPLNPIEGQLWYDTSNPGRKVLRVNNGSATSARWPSANGIYQQATDPGIQYGQTVIDGDVWVDTGSTQLKIRYGNSWTLVGPNVSSGDAKTGSESVNLISNTGETYPVILNWVNGKVVEIIAYHTFTPRTVIDGFASLNPGVNLTTRVAAKYNGLADRAKALEVSNGVYIQASEVLKNQWPSAQRQTLAGSLIVESALGLFIRRPNQTTKEIKIGTSTGTNVGLVEYSFATGSLKVGVTDNSYIFFNGDTRRVGINTSNNTGTLTVNGTAYINGAVTATGSLYVTGATAITGNTTIAGKLNVAGVTTLTNFVTVAKDIVPSAGNVTLGSALAPFDRIYVNSIGTTSTDIRIYGTITKAVQLETGRDFRITGVVTSNTVRFDGTATVTFTATAHKSLITGLQTTSTTSATQTLMVVNTATDTFNSISKRDFLSDVYASIITTGMILAAGTSTIYNIDGTTSTNYLLCNGAPYLQVNYQNLYNVIRDNYNTGTTTAGYFKVPNLTTATINGYNAYPIYYHIKT